MAHSAKHNHLQRKELSVRNLRSLTDSENNTTSWRYDNLDRMTQDTITIDTTSGSLSVTRFLEYDLVGNLTKKTDRNGRVIDYSFDRLDRLVTETWQGAGGRNISFEYNLVNELTRSSDPDHTYDFELAKMAVSPKFQGKGIGSVLGNAVIDKARDLGAKKIYLESNTVLGPAINLYRKLGFTKVTGVPSPYARCNIQMELAIE